MTNFICVVFGKKGSGKTTLIRRASLFLKRVVIFDPLNEYVNGVVIVDSASLAEYLIANHEKNFRVVFKSIVPFDNVELLCKITFQSHAECHFFNDLFSHYDSAYF